MTPAPLKICMISMSLYPSDPRVRREAEALQREGHEVDVICLRSDGQSTHETVNGVHAHRVLQERDKEKLLQYILFSSLFWWVAFFALQRLWFSRRHHLIHIHNMPDHLVFVTIIQRITGVPVILDLHDLMVELFESKWSAAKSKWLLPLVRLDEKLSCRFASHVIATSEGFRRSLLERNISEHKVTLILNSADPNIFACNNSRKFEKIERGANLIYHGTVANRFGLATLVEAVAKLQESIPGTTLNVYGKYDPSVKADLERIIRKHKLEDYVNLNGYHPLEEVCQFIEQSDIGVVPYLSDVFMNLALSTKSFEYAAMGLPIVASRLDSISMIFDDDCVMYFEPGNAEDLAQKIADCCLNPERRQHLSQRASQAYDNMSWPVMARRYVELVRSLTGEREK